MLDWRARRRSRDDVPGAIRFKEIEGGTHVASVPISIDMGCIRCLRKR